jgi:hypothetical protein
MGELKLSIALKTPYPPKADTIAMTRGEHMLM